MTRSFRFSILVGMVAVLLAVAITPLGALLVAPAIAALALAGAPDAAAIWGGWFLVAAILFAAIRLLARKRRGI